MEEFKFWSRKLYRRVIQEIGSRIYINSNLDLHKSILVAGTARSGTTWLGDLIASQLPSRILFEPFNPILIPEYSAFSYFQYMRPGTKNPKFHAFVRKVFTGEIRNRWIDHYNERIFFEYRLIKAIRVNLALKWLHDNFSMVPIIFIVRHPCAVVLSRIKLDWATDSDIKPFLLQPDFVEDHLAPYMDLIRTAKTVEEKHAIIWSVSNFVPLKQFEPGELKIVYYENLCTRPQIEMTTIFDSIGQKSVKLKFDKIDRPSQTARLTSAIVNGNDKIAGWKKKLSTLQINNILRIVDKFGLSHLYGDSLLPLNRDAI